MEDRQVSPDLYTREYYEHVQGYQDWNATHGRRLPPRLARAVRLAKIRAGMRCLDVGCGRGEVVLRCAMAGAAAIGVDYSPDSVDIAREALASYPDEVRRRCTFDVMDGRKLDFPDGSFDRVFMLDLVEHLYPEALVRILTQARRVLKPDGLLVVHSEPNRNYSKLAVKAFQSRTAGWMVRPLTQALTGSNVPFSPFRESMHVNEQDPDSLRATLEMAGFKARVWCSGLYGYEELREWRSVLKRTVLSGWPVTLIGPLAKTFGVNVWAVATP